MSTIAFPVRHCPTEYLSPAQFVVRVMQERQTLDTNRYLLGSGTCRDASTLTRLREAVDDGIRRLGVVHSNWQRWESLYPAQERAKELESLHGFDAVIADLRRPAAELYSTP